MNEKQQAYQAAADATALASIPSWSVFEAALLGFAETYELGQQRAQVIIGRLRPMSIADRGDQMLRMAKMLRNQARLAVVRSI